MKGGRIRREEPATVNGWLDGRNWLSNRYDVAASERLAPDRSIDVSIHVVVGAGLCGRANDQLLHRFALVRPNRPLNLLRQDRLSTKL